MENIQRIEVAKDVSFNYINDERFKTGKISVYFVIPLEKETASINALLSEILCASCNKYSDFQSLNRYLDKLYGANLDVVYAKKGDAQIICISLTGLDDRYTINQEVISNKFADLLCELIFNPNIIDGEFSKADFLQEKRQLIDTIDSDFNEKRVHALNRLTQEMFKDEKYGILSYGTSEDVTNLNLEDIKMAWLELLKTARIEIMMVGSSSYEFALNVFKKAFSSIDREIKTVQTEVVSEVEEVKEIIEKEDVSQSKLVMGFRSSISNKDSQKEVTAFKFMSAILGGTPQSKFFVNVREKHSLCYYCASRPITEKGALIIDSGVETQNIEKAKKEILNQIALLQSGDLTDFEMDSTKMSIINSYKTSTDSILGIENWYASQILNDKLKTPQEAIDEVMAVTKQEVIDVSNKIKLDTIYILTSQD